MFGGTLRDREDGWFLAKVRMEFEEALIFLQINIIGCNYGADAETAKKFATKNNGAF